MEAPAQVVIFGASGDLARRKLLPAFARLAASGRPKSGFQVIGVSRSPLSDEDFRGVLREALGPEDRALADELAPRLFYQSCDASSDDDLRALAKRLDELAGGQEVGRLFYLALKPELFATVVARLAEARLLERRSNGVGGWRRLVVEKPFGHDFESAHALNLALHDLLDEHQLFRIDHYLGKETVQNLLGFRFHNAIFEPLWNRQHVELVEITVAESLGVEDGRASYYDSTGALRDMLQNHMLQVLALVAMEAPSSLAAEDVRDRKVEVLRALRCPDAVDLAVEAVRARYTAGELDGVRARGYLEEDGVPADSSTETYVAMRAEVGTWRWSGVPFLLRHGKRLPHKRTEVRVQFRTPPIQLFNRPDGISEAEFRRKLRDGSLCQIRPNVLTLAIQPREEIRLTFGVKRPGGDMVMSPAQLAFDYREHFGKGTPDAYERLLLDALVGDATLFLRADEVEASWRYADEVRAGWKRIGAPLLEYPAGSFGPAQADALFQGCEGGWSRG